MSVWQINQPLGGVAVRALFFIVVVFATNAVCATDTAEADAVTADAVEAGTSCVVIHEKSSAGSEKSVTCFENVALARTSFESGVCQWKTDGQANEEIKTITKFVEFCPASYSAYCDRLVLGPHGNGTSENISLRQIGGRTDTREEAVPKRRRQMDTRGRGGRVVHFFVA